MRYHHDGEGRRNGDTAERRQAPGGRPGVKNTPKPAWRGHHTGNSWEGRNQAGIGVTRLAAEYGMLEVVIESQENPSENPADAEGRSESGVDPSGAASQETGSDPHTVAEQRAPITPLVLESQPPRPKVLVRVLSRVCEDGDEVDAAVEEIGAQLGRPAHIAIQALESNLSNELQTQREGLDAQQAAIREQGAATRAQTGRIDALGERVGAQGAAIQENGSAIRENGSRIRENGSKIQENGSKIDALGETVATQGAEVRENGSKIRENGSRIRENGSKIDALGETVATQGAEVRENGSKIDALKTEVRVNGANSAAQDETLKTEIKSLRSEIRIILAVGGLLIALGLLDWLPTGCSRPVESGTGTEASQTVAEPSEDAPSPPAATREPAAEAAETDEPAEADAELSVAGPEPRR